MNSNHYYGATKQQRIGKRELQILLERTSERDRAILQALHDYKYLLTGQVQRLYFRQAISKLAATRATNRCLLRLEDWGLLATLKRRIGGVRAGSSSYVWVLTPTGYRLLGLLDNLSINAGGSDKTKPARKRTHEPSPTFLQHTLAVAEVAIRLTELTASRKIGLLERQVEPDCWRNYTNAGGTASTLRPDLFAVTSPISGNASKAEAYEDYWFIEVDLATESPAVVVRKCQQYLIYLRSGEEQRRSGVCPLVVWIVPDGKRKETLLAHIAESLPDNKRLFIAITLDELNNLLVNGLANE
jgi:hypothetical protein